MEATELISRCKAGERQALNLLYQQYKPQLLNICRQYAVVIFTSLDRLENDDKLEAWMFSIVRNVGYHYRQHVDKEQAALQQLAKEKPETTETDYIADYNELQSLVTLLPQGYQQVFRLSVFEGLSHQEISQLLGITPHSSSSQLSHAKQMLRRLIRQSWVLVLLFIAIPAAIWQFLKKDKEPRNHSSYRQRKSLRNSLYMPPSASIRPLTPYVIRQKLSFCQIASLTKSRRSRWILLQKHH